MACQVLHDSLHGRPGWTEWYELEVSGETAGYGAVVVAGPWAGTRALFEIYVLPPHRSMLLGLADILIETAKVDHLLVQTNDRTLVMLLHQFGDDAKPDKVVFARGGRTHLPGLGAIFRRATEADQSAIFKHEREPVGDWLLEFGGEIIATGGYLSHYNPPYVDIYMEVRGDMRRRGFGSYLVQEIKRVAEENRKISCGRCDVDNHASLKTMVRAGMVPCAHRITAKIKPG